MPNQDIRIGVPQVFLSVDNGVDVPDLSTIVQTVTDTLPSDALNNDTNQPLLTTDTYNVVVGAVGVDMTNGGYTIGKTCAPLAAGVTISAAGRGLKVYWDNADWPSGYDSAICAGVFLKINSAQYQLAGFAYIDDIADFNYLIFAKPLRVAPKFADSKLFGTSAPSTNAETAGAGVVIEMANTLGILVSGQVLVRGSTGSGVKAEVCTVSAVTTNVSITVSSLAFTYTSPMTIYNLATIVADPILGDRNPQGVGYEEITPTTGDFTFRRPVQTVTVSPNTSVDFTVKTAQSSGVSFSALSNDIKTFVRAASGIYVKFAGDGGSVIQQSQMSLNTAQAILRGNRSIKVYLPPDGQGNQEIRLLVGLLTFSQIELTETWSKTAPTPVTFQFDAASMDRLINNLHTEISYLRQG